MAEKIINLKEGINIAINDFGNSNGNVIVINHGMIASIKDEKLFQKLIDNDFRIITIARPGYGRSSIYEYLLYQKSKTFTSIYDGKKILLNEKNPRLLREFSSALKDIFDCVSC